MSIAYKLQFGSYALPSTLRPDEPLGASFDLAEQDLPRFSGASSQVGRKKSRSLAVRGELSSADLTTLAGFLDGLASSLTTGYQQLYYGRDDRYYVAQVESLTGTAQDGRLWGRFFNVSIGFRASDPDAYASSPTTVSGLGGGGTVTPAGTSLAQPKWTVTIGSTGPNLVTLTNTTTGEVATFKGFYTAGDVIVLDRTVTPMAVSLNGAANFGIFDGRIPQLAASTNTITVAAILGSVTVSVVWTDRFA